MKSIILIVDDTPQNLNVLKGGLSPEYQVRPAPNGQVALRAAAVHPPPDLILLDIMMPGMDGYEVCRRLKENPQTRDIPVIFVTAKTEVEDEVAGLKVGAVDYITKPFNIAIVLARVKTHLALSRATRQLEEQNHHLRQEREFIESIILKMRSADAFDDRHLRHLVLPVEATAGDVLLAGFTADGRQLVLLGDFTGHGLSSAIGGPLVTYIFHHQLRHGASAQELLQEINQQIHLRMPLGIFFAIILLEVSSDRTHAFLWNAALPEAVLLRQGTIQGRFPSVMPPLGIGEAANITKAATPLALEPGDRLYVFSDGIIEAANPADELFGMDRLEGFLLDMNRDALPMEELFGRLQEHTGQAVHGDDITLIEVNF